MKFVKEKTIPIYKECIEKKSLTIKSQTHEYFAKTNSRTMPQESLKKQAKPPPRPCNAASLPLAENISSLQTQEKFSTPAAPAMKYECMKTR